MNTQRKTRVSVSPGVLAAVLATGVGVGVASIPTPVMAKASPPSSACEADISARQAAFEESTKLGDRVISSRMPNQASLEARSCLGGILNTGFGFHLPFGNPWDMLKNAFNKACAAARSAVYDKMAQANERLFGGTIAEGSGIDTSGGFHTNVDDTIDQTKRGARHAKDVVTDAPGAAQNAVKQAKDAARRAGSSISNPNFGQSDGEQEKSGFDYSLIFK